MTFINYKLNQKSDFPKNLKGELFNFVYGEKEESQACALFASENQLKYDDCWNIYNIIKTEYKKLEILIKKHQDKSKKLINNTKIIPWEDWEYEILILAKNTFFWETKIWIAKFLHEKLPHRTSNSWKSKFYSLKLENNNTNNIQNENQNIKSFTENKIVSLNKIKKGDIVECHVAKIHPTYALLVTRTGYTGLLHISKIVDAFVEDVNDWLYLNQKIKAKIDKIEGEKIYFNTLDLELKPLNKNMLKLSKTIPKNIQENIQKENINKDNKELDIFIGDDLIMNLDGIISQMEYQLENLKMLRKQFLEKEKSYKQIQELKEKISKLL